jgi:hypothetical protein
MNNYTPSERPLTVEEVAARYSCSIRTVHERTRLLQMPHHKHPGGRRNYYPPRWLDEWDGGAELEIVELGNGGRVVRPKLTRASRRRLEVA